MSEPVSAADLTADKALSNAARLLYHAEAETNLPLMERLDSVANSWLAIAAFLISRERDDV